MTASCCRCQGPVKPGIATCFRCGTRSIYKLEQDLAKARSHRDQLNARIRSLSSRVKWAKKRAGRSYPSPALALRQLIGSGKRFTTRDVLELSGAPEGSVSGVLFKFVQSGKLVRVARAVYEPGRKAA